MTQEAWHDGLTLEVLKTLDCRSAACEDVVKAWRSIIGSWCRHLMLVNHRRRRTDEHFTYDLIVRHGTAEAVFCVETGDTIVSTWHLADVSSWLRRVHEYEEG